MSAQLEEVEVDELERVTGGCECHGVFVVNSCNTETHIQSPPPSSMPQGEKT